MCFPIKTFLLLFLCINQVLSAEERTLPSTWSWADVAGMNYLARSQSEHAPEFCQSSWALSVTAALSSRLKITQPMKQTVVLSPQVLINCSPGNCSFGTPSIVYEYISVNGVPDETCQNYEGKEHICDDVGICRDCDHGKEQFLPGYCWGVPEYKLYGLEDHGVIESTPYGTNADLVTQMKDEIWHNGPITCTIYPSLKFNNYQEGIITNSMWSVSDSPLYVNIIGWDETSESKVWIGENYWGNYWGYDGLFKIEMGVNALGVESACSWGKPKELGMKPTSLNSFKQRTKKSCDCIHQPPDFTPRISFSEPRANFEIPESYDIRNLNGRNYATIDKNQHIPHYCGSCWAFAVTTSLADRLSLMHPGASHLIDISTQALINCASIYCRGCRGGWPYFAFDYILRNGLPHETCSPYLAVQKTCKDVNICRKCTLDKPCCTAVHGTSYLSFNIISHGEVIGEEAMKKEITSGGPMSCMMYSTDEFHAYKGGIINSTVTAEHPNHAVELTGWGQENGIEYWIIRNR
eukprot:g6447.t2